MLYPAVRRPPTRCKTNGLVTAATLRFKTGLIVGFPDEKRPRCAARIHSLYLRPLPNYDPHAPVHRLFRDGASGESTRTERLNFFSP